MKRNSFIVIFPMIAALALASVWVREPAEPRYLPVEPLTIVHGNQHRSLLAEVADEAAERRFGLMYRKELPKGRGMLFLYEREEPIAMWMKNTYIPLDMLFIDAHGVIVSMVESAEPLSETRLESGVPAKAVLEIPAGTIVDWNLAIGDWIEHDAFQ